MAYPLPPIVKLSERLLREIELAVRGFARYHKYTLGTDLRTQAMQVVRVCHRAWRDRRRQMYWTDQLIWAIDEINSQLFANIYMNRLDQFVKHELKARRYVRYADDFILVHRDREILAAWQVRIASFLARELRLRLKDDIRLRPLGDGIDFLGYMIKPTHTLVRRRVVSHLRTALADWERAHVARGFIRATPADLRSIQSIAASYGGHLRHANSQRLRRGLEQRFPWLPTAIRPRRFHHDAEGHRITLRIRNAGSN